MECIKKNTERKEFRRISKRIEKELNNDRKEKEKQYKVLVLGASDVGKSTFIKQMKIMHSGGFTLKEKQDAKEIVLSNLVICVYIILCQMQSLQDQSMIKSFSGFLNCIDKDDEDLITLQQFTKCLFMNLSFAEKKEISNYTSIIIRPTSSEEEDKLSKFCDIERFPEQAQRRNFILDKIWQNEEFTNILLSLGPIKLPDSALYFLKNFDRLLSDTFLPTNNDILRMRRSTTGVLEAMVPFEKCSIRLVDVGGQRNERRKWIQCFDDVSSIIFIASLAEYNMHLVEDQSANRLRESIALFKTILETSLFEHRSFILFLNKRDIFDEKITIFDLKDSFEEYEGKVRDKNEATNFILNKFIKKKRTIIYSHLTCAVDQDNIKFVFSAAKQIIFKNCIQDILDQGLF